MSDTHDHDLERSVIKWIMGNPDYLRQLSLSPEDFHDESYRDIFKIINDQYLKSGYIDEKILRSLSKEKVPEEAIDDVMEAEVEGGVSYIDEIKRYSNSRKLKRLLMNTMDSINNNDVDVVDTFEHKFYEIQKTFGTSKLPMSAEEMSEAYEEHWEELISGKSKFYKSGYSLIDDYVCFQPKKLYTLAARTGIGKTSLAQTMGIGFSSNNFKTLYFSLEQDHIELSERILSIYSKISNTRFKYGNVPRDQLSSALETFKEHQRNFYLHWETHLTLPKILRIASDMKNKVGLDFIIIDYLQLIKPHYRMKADTNMHRFLSEITSSLKRLAGDLNCGVMILSQISRGGDETKPPMLSSLKESGSIEENSDAVMMLHRDSRDSDNGTLTIAKNRSGPSTGIVNLDFTPHLTLYKESLGQDLKPIEHYKSVKEQIKIKL
jgi:replicative DNA helicase